LQAQPFFTPNQGAPMGLDVGGILGAVGNLFGGVSAVPALQGFGGVLSSIAPSFSPTLTAMPQQLAVRPRLGSTSISSLSNELITAGGKLLGTLGVQITSASAFSSILRRTVGGIASLAARTPGLTVLGILGTLGLTAFEASLVVAHHATRKRGRRMNPANSKALRRAARRIKSFHRLCTHTDVLRVSRRGGSRPVRCGTCRKSPCRC